MRTFWNSITRPFALLLLMAPLAMACHGPRHGMANLSESEVAERMEDVAQLFPNVGLVQDVVDFIRNASARGVCQPLPDGPKSA